MSKEVTSQMFKKRRFVRWLWIASALTVACGLAFWRWQIGRDDKPNPGNAAQAAAPVPLEFAPSDIARVEKIGLERNIAFSGTLVPVLQSSVKSTIGGDVLRMSVREGDMVQRGQVVAEIDTADLRPRLEAAIADQQERRSRWAIALQNRDSNQSLLEQGFISKSAYSQIENTLKGSEAAVQWADAQVKQIGRAHV